jgi:hypothetical protein
VTLCGLYEGFAVIVIEVHFVWMFQDLPDLTKLVLEIRQEIFHRILSSV